MPAVYPGRTSPDVRAQTTVLVVVQDVMLRDMICKTLWYEGYVVVRADTSTVALSEASTRHVDLILLDVLLTPLDGLTCCRMLRHASDVPIILFASHQEAMDGIVGLELGADDYLMKPFRLVELLARISALLRRSTGRPTVLPREVHVVGELRVDVGARRVFRGGTEVLLAPKTFDLLVFLIRHRGAIVSRDTVRTHLWGREHSIRGRTIDVHIRWLREKVESDPGCPRYIHTVRGLGYRFADREAGIDA